MEYRSVADVARATGITQQAIRKRIRLGQIRAERIGRDWLIPVGEATRIATEGRYRPGPKPRSRQA